MVAMAIMVYSFRVSFDQWLGKLLPADLQLREPFGNDTAYWSPGDQARLGAVPGIARIEFRRTRQLLLDPARAPVTLIARDASAAEVAKELPLIKGLQAPLAAGTRPAWISEALQDLYGYKLGESISLPLAGREQRFTIAGVWRDYARAFGAVVISRTDYIEATGDESANEGSIWLDGRISSIGRRSGAARPHCAARGVLARDFDEHRASRTLAADLRSCFRDHLRARSHRRDHRTHRRELCGEFNRPRAPRRVRHAAPHRHAARQVVGMLASEGVLMSIFGVAYGLILGAALSLVLVYVVNRQSFNWSIDLAIPAWQLAVLSITLILAAAVTAIWSGRAAMSQDAVRAVREDW